MPKVIQDLPTGREQRHVLPLIGLTTLIVLTHWMLLTSTPLASASTTLGKPPASLQFTARTIQPVTVLPIKVASPKETGSQKQKQRPQARQRDVASTHTHTNLSAAVPAAESVQSPVPDVGVLPTPEPLPEKITDDQPTHAQDDTLVELAINTALTAPPTSSPIDTIALNFAVPAPARLKYQIKGEVKGFPYFANGELLWQQDGANYQARLEISHFLLGSRVQTSKGQLTQQGLEPLRFGDKVRSEVAAHFERSKNKVSFSANTPDAPLLPGAQDQLSVFIQLAGLLGGNPDRFPSGTAIPFQAVGPRSSESWIFTVGATESQTLPGGVVTATKLTREAMGEFDPRVEVWLAPSMDFLPVRIRLAQSNGDFVEQQWRSTQKP